MEDKRWRVLIADDEPKVCALIQYLIPWEELGLELAAVVSNGLEAMDVLKEKPVDIVITDARMPECDGIELIKWCHQRKMQLKYMVISGYRHFEYAHGALQYGVDYYLLKPINQKELIQSLREIVGQLEQELTEKKTNIEMQNQMLRDRDKLRRHFIGSYIFDGRQFCQREIQSVEEINEEYQMHFADGIYQAVFIKLDNARNMGVNIEKLLGKIKTVAEELLKDFGNENVGTMLHSGVIFLMNYPVEKEALFHRLVEVLYEEIEKLLDIFEKLQVTIGISCREDSIRNINRCIVTAGEAIKFRIHLQNKNIIFYEKYKYEVMPTENIWTAERKKMLESFIRIGNREGLKKLIFECRFELHQRKNISPVMIYAVIQEMSITTMHIFEETLEEAGEKHTMFGQFDEAMDLAMSEEMLWEALETLFDKCIETIASEMQRQQTKPIRMVKEYIDSHYNEAITLEMAAEKAGLSANYVSAIFRKETGVNFSDYITARRMDAATELLRKTDLSIGEIAERVGYTDVKHFSKLCKKTLGMKPSEYRKLYS